jgi:hypothetical protein
MHYKRDEKMVKMAAEVAGKFVGPMPVVDFLQTFLPRSGTIALSKEQETLLKKAAEESSEEKMYGDLVRLYPQSNRYIR